jgi:secreted trypsin-like serine protease
VRKKCIPPLALWAALIVAVGLSTPVQGVSPRIVGGASITISTTPWQVSLAIRNSRNSTQCGASIIGSSWLVTAAHCVVGAAAGDISAFVGITNLSERTNQNALAVSGITINPSWNPTTFNGDIALLQLASPLTFSTNVQPIALPLTQDATSWPAAGTVAQISGWGSRSFGGGFSDPLLAANVSILGGPNENSCGSYGSSFTSLDKICAGVIGGGVDTCQGDSGGPLVVSTAVGVVLAGLTSVGNNCALANFPGIYTRITTFLPWINQYVPPPTSVPNPPIKVTATSRANERVSVSWNPPAYNGGLAISGYQVSLLRQTGELTPVCAATESPCVVTDQRAGTVLSVVVQAVNSLGSSAASTPVEAIVVNGVRTAPAKLSQQLVARWAGVSTQSGEKPRVRIAPSSRGICTIKGSQVALVRSGLCTLRVTGANSQKGTGYLLGN